MEDLLLNSLLNRSDKKVLTDAQSTIQPSTAPSTPPHTPAFMNQEELPSVALDFTPSESLTDKKVKLLDQKRNEKLNNLNGTSTPEVDYLDSLNGDSSNIIDRTQSAFIQSGGNIADAYAWTQQNLLGNTDYKLSTEVDNLSDVNTADKIAGYTGRADADLRSNGIRKSFDKGNYFEALVQTVQEAPEFLADSLPTVAEFIVGSLLTEGAYGATKIAETGAKLLSYGSKINKSKKASEAVKTTATLTNLAVKSSKFIGKTSIASLDMTGQMISDYKKSHNGESPSTTRVLTTFGAYTLTNGLEFGIFKNAIKSGTLNEFKSVMEESAKLITSESAFKSIGVNLLRQVKNVGITAGAEAAQEYLQTWVGILADKTEGKNALASLAKELMNSDNQEDANYGAFIGGIIGGTVRGTGSVPSVATNVTANTVKGTMKTASNAVANKLANSSYKLLSEADRQQIKDKYNTEDAIHKNLVEESNKNIDSLQTLLNKNEPISEEALTSLNDPIVNGFIEKFKKLYPDKDLSSDILKSVNEKAIAAHKANILNSKTSLETRRAKDATYRVYKNTSKGLKNTANDIAEKYDLKDKVKKVYKVTTDTLGNALENTKHFKSSTAKGVFDQVYIASVDKTVLSKNKVHSLLKDLKESEVSDINTLLELTDENTQPYLHKGLTSLQKAKEDARAKLGLYGEDIQNSFDASSVIGKLHSFFEGKPISTEEIKQTQASGKGIPKQLLPSLANELLNGLTKKFTDPKLLTSYQNAYEYYKVSGDTSISPSTLNKINSHISSEFESVGSVKGKVKHAIKTAVKGVSEASSFTKKAAEDMFDNLNGTYKNIRIAKKIFNKQDLSEEESIIYDQNKENIDSYVAEVTKAKESFSDNEDKVTTDISKKEKVSLNQFLTPIDSIGDFKNIYSTDNISKMFSKENTKEVYSTLSRAAIDFIYNTSDTSEKGIQTRQKEVISYLKDYFKNSKTPEDLKEFVKVFMSQHEEFVYNSEKDIETSSQEDVNTVPDSVISDACK